jgi:H+/Cl- antiporter ClcA
VNAAAPPAPPSGRDYFRLILLGAIIGIPAAIAAAVFLELVHLLQDWLWIDLPAALGTSTPPWYLVLGLPLVGAVIVLAARTLLPGDGGHEPLDGFGGPPTPVRYVPGVALAALGTLPFGIVLGPEAPLIALGSAVGLFVAGVAKRNAQESAVLGSAGSFSAISALFGGPIVAGILLIEAGVGMGTALIPILLPGLVAASIGYILFVGLGEWAGFHAASFIVPDLPPYVGTHLLDLVLGVAVGIAAGVLMALIRWLATRVAAAAQDRTAALLLGGALAVGGLALAAQALGANSQDVLFSGQNSIGPLVAQSSVAVVLILLVAKGLAYAISLGAGFRGGPVFPALFVGVALATLAVVLFKTSPTLAVAVGAAAGTAAATRLVFASLVFSAMLVGTGNLDVVPAAALATVAAWLTATAIERATGTLADVPGEAPGSS